MRKIWTIVSKELKRYFTDPRMLLALFLPGVLIFVLYTAIGGITQNISDNAMNNVDPSYSFKVDITDNSGNGENTKIGQNIISTLEILNYNNIDLTYISKDNINESKTDIEQNSKDLLVIFTDNFELQIENSGSADTIKPEISFVYNSNRMESVFIFEIVNQSLNTIYRNFDSQAIDKGTNNAIGNMIISLVFPMITLTCLYSVVMSIAPESIAGEKERGTIASILITPIKRSEFAFGKMIAVALTSLASGLFTFVTIIFSMDSVVQVGGGIAELLTVSNIFLFLFLIITTVILLATLACYVSSLAKSIKEASSYLGPLISLFIVAALLPSLMPVIVENIGFAFVPILNISSCFVSIVNNSVDIRYFIVTIIINISFTALFIFLTSKSFKSERIMFNK